MTALGRRKVYALVCRVGDAVGWTSSAGRHVGVVVAVVPPGALPADLGHVIPGAEIPRRHESYVVRSGDKAFWPAMAVLRAIAAGN